MKKSTLKFISFVVKTSLALVAVSAGGCAVAPAPEQEPVGEAQSAVIQWTQPAETHSTRNTTGIALPANAPSCVLAGLEANFDKGQSNQWDVQSLFSEAGIINNHLVAHGGAYTDQNNQRVWADNTVGARATCFGPLDTQSGWALWGGISGNYSPTKIVNGAPNRQCFLESLEAADNTFNSTSDFVQVKFYAAPDATHSSAGWYIEGNLNLNIGASGPPSATAVCYDFPDSQEFGGYVITSTAGHFATQNTFANILAGCGLTRVAGPFTSNSTSTGVYVDFESTAGVWVLHAYGGQSGTAVCID
jgi:hypothetical protein